MTARLVCAAVAAVLVAGSAVAAPPKARSHNATACLSGFDENPSVSTTGNGTLELRIDDASRTVEFELRYGDLEGVAPFVTDGVVIASHIHLSSPGVNGGVAAFLCGGGGRPDCPTPSGVVTGEIVPSDVIGPAVQGIDAGEQTAFDEFVAAIRAGYTYVNVHTTRWTGGEIRGQIK